MKDKAWVLSGLLFTAACATEVASDESKLSSEDDEVAPLYTVEVAPGHTIEFIDLGRGARFVDEHASAGSELVTAIQTRSFAAMFRQIRPDTEVPEVLVEADKAWRSDTKDAKGPNDRVGLVTQAVSTEDWKNELGGCACPLGDVVHKYCKEGRTGNWSDTQVAEYAWFNINHISGNGMDAVVRCDNDTLKRRFRTGDIGRLTCIGPDGFLGVDIYDIRMRLEINGADGDVMDLSSCWTIY